MARKTPSPRLIPGVSPAYPVREELCPDAAHAKLEETLKGFLERVGRQQQADELASENTDEH